MREGEWYPSPMVQAASQDLACPRVAGESFKQEEDMKSSVLQVWKQARVYDLGQPFFVGMPRRMSAPPFTFSLIRGHNDTSPEFSSAAGIFGMGDHTGTHIDALAHIAENKKVYGHTEDVFQSESYGEGVRIGGIEETPPIIRRGVLLDVPLVRGVAVLKGDDEVTAADLASAEEKHGVRVEEGDVVLIRTGWARYFDSDPHKFNSADTIVAGVGMSAAEWLAQRKISCTGSDTTAYEKVNKTQLMVHRLLLGRCGIQIIESMNLEELAREKLYEFVFVALPLRIIGATGAPIRPIALV